MKLRVAVVELIATGLGSAILSPRSISDSAVFLGLTHVYVLYRLLAKLNSFMHHLHANTAKAR